MLVRDLFDLGLPVEEKLWRCESVAAVDSEGAVKAVWEESEDFRVAKNDTEFSRGVERSFLSCDRFSATSLSGSTSLAKLQRRSQAGHSFEIQGIFVLPLLSSCEKSARLRRHLSRQRLGGKLREAM